jgi:cellulose synthase/poly-beta-1,6-N-acetylglucosamine synthase-like glycosyltransferase
MPFENILHIIFLSFVSFYALVLLGLSWGVVRRPRSHGPDQPFASVIVAARNEERHLPGLLAALLNQKYPDFEIIVVNDRSTDDTPSLLSKYERAHPNIHRIDIVTASKEMPAKKHALAAGIAASRGEILLFTDADCLPPPGWIKALVGQFNDKVGIVAGYSPYRGPKTSVNSLRVLLLRLLHYFIEYEEFKGATWSAGSIGVDLGWLCTGRSLAYRKSIYNEVGGFEGIKQSVSGDDDLFMQLVRRNTRCGIRYVTSPDSFVPTFPPGSFQEFVSQRTRHFSAGKYFSWPMKLFFFTFHLANLSILLSLVVALLTGSSLGGFVPFAVKSAVDSLLFVVGATDPIQ